MTPKRKFFVDGVKLANLEDVKFTPPDFLSVQRDSFEKFILQEYNDNPESRPDNGLESVFREVFPIEDIHGRYKIEYLYYYLDEPKYTPEQVKEKELTYSASLYGRFRLIEYEEPEEVEFAQEIEDFEPFREVKQSIEQDVFLASFPLMTERGDFIINGVERVIISQLHRAPGVYFEEEEVDEVRSKYNAQIIPDRGSWLKFNIKLTEAIKVNLNGRRNFPITVLIKALGYLEDIKILEEDRKKLIALLKEKEYNEKYIKRIKEIDEKLENVEGKWNNSEQILSIFFKSEEIKIDKKAIGRVIAKDIVAPDTGEVILQAGNKLEEDCVKKIKEAGFKNVYVFKGVEKKSIDYILNAFRKDKTKNGREAILEIYRYLRGTDAPNLRIAKDYFYSSFFDPARFNLSKVGRHVLNRKLNQNVDENLLCLVTDDFVNVVKGLMELADGKKEEDDIDHLGNRRIRTVGEQLENQFRVALRRMAKTITERMVVSEDTDITPQELINSRQIKGVLNSFFATGQLSQFLDQTNPLAELTNKRRLSALGPGGLTRDTAGFAVRDVHYSHYGRICPIETPEGPNIGLITSLASISMIDEDGFIETPYRKVKKGVITDEVEYLNVNEEDKYTIAPANLKVDKKGKIVDDYVMARRRDAYPFVKREEVDYVDLVPQQLVSVSSSLIPFLEHDDANRALMGSNMQRQAVPLIRPEAPLVGTGIEGKVAKDSGTVILAKRDGVVIKVTADEIWIKTKEADSVEPYDIYNLRKFERTNQDTCVNQKPIVNKEDEIKAGDVIADGGATSDGELALGQNVLVALIPYFGWNYEDAIVVSERLLKEDVFSSYHIEEYTCEVRDTKLGSEETTREIPNVSEESAANLDEEGIVRLGAKIKEGDILVGKISPKGETELTPEEKLLRAIFGKKAEDVKDTSLRVPSDVHGVVIGAVVLERNARKANIDKVIEEYSSKIQELKRRKSSTVSEELLDKKTKDSIFIASKRGKKKKLLVRKNQVIKEKHLAKLEQWVDLKAYPKIQKFIEKIDKLIEKLEKQMENTLKVAERGDELAAGVNKMIKVYIGQRRRISIGDKVSGRHGNKGVVAAVIPEEDMPFMEDGTPVDVVLNPLGVPSRMNVGQILETHLGWAAEKLNIKVGSPIFEGVSIEKIKELLKEAGLPESGKVTLYDGRTGEPFEQQITVGYMYLMKLYHMIEDKHHARATGPYSLITQQPLGGKAQYGGQRFGEMEVWALEGYGAAHTLQEMLTIKSDDVEGRNKAYEAIVKGEPPPEPGLPTSFDVLIKELRGLGLNVELLKQGEEEKYEI
ncbi:DNA-directed RNA polymerase subunit beta [candidate division WOR-3 bacterium]|nr:DNA-directed RNA polymerase subunit beta [candidate division WOR-3 bacterium]